MDESKAIKSNERTRQLDLKHFADYAKFLLEKKLVHELLREQLKVSKEMNLPLLKYFSFLSDEELLTIGEQSLIEFLHCASDNTLHEYIQSSLKNWLNNQLPVLLKNQVMVEDITLSGYIRKRVLTKFLPLYTTDIDEIFSISNEIDLYNIENASSSFKIYANIQQEKMNEQLTLIQQNESYYKRAEAITHIGNWRWNVNENKLIWTEELHKIYDLPPDAEISYDNIASYNVPEDASLVSDAISKSLNSLKPFDFFYRIITPKENLKILHAIGEVITNEKGEPVTLLGTVQDVTSQKSMESRLIEQNTFIQKIADVTPSIITAYNVHTGKYIYINNGLERLLGYKVEDALKGGVEFFVNLVHPDDLEPLMKRNAEALQRANEEMNIEEEMISDFKYRMRHNNGTYRWFHTFGTVFDRNANNEVEHVLNISLDFTEEQLLRTQLEEEKTFAELLIESSPDMILAFDNDLRITAWNHKSEEQLGYKKEEVLGRKWTELFPEDSNEEWINNMKPAFQGKMLHFPKIKFIHNPYNGYGEVYVVPLKNKEGEVFNILTITRNITEIVYANERFEKINEDLRRSEERYHKMIDEVQDYAIILLNKDGYVENWNKGAEKIKGYKTEEIVGKHFSIFYTEENKRENLPARLIKEAEEKGKATYEGWRVKKDGSLFWGNTVITALHDDRSNIIGFVKVTRDLTEAKMAEDNLREYAKQLEAKNHELNVSNEQLKIARKELAEDRTRVLIEAMPHIVATANAEGTLNYSNRHLMDYTGYSFEEIRNGLWVNAVHPDDLKKILAAWKASISTGEHLQIEFRFKRADSEYLWHLAIAKPLYDEERHNILMWIITFTNIHDQKMMDEKKDEFIGIASHELKTPLTSAKAYTQLLQSLMKNEKNEEALLYVKKANLFIDRLNNLITELLDISKIQHGKLMLKITQFNFNEMLKETIEFMQASTKHTIRLSGFATKPIKGDKERIQQVLINLLSNAVKYSPDASFVDVTISQTQNQLQVDVKDYGIGIPKTDLNRIFERFYRVQDNATKFQGLGIGLFISAEIVRRHNGNIWVESNPHKGSTFHFSLPLNDVA